MLVNPHGPMNVGRTGGKIVKQAKTMRVNLHIPVNAGTNAHVAKEWKREATHTHTQNIAFPPAATVDEIFVLSLAHGHTRWKLPSHGNTFFMMARMWAQTSVDTPSKIHRESDCKSKWYHGSEFGGWLNEGPHLCNLAIQAWHQRAKEFLYQEDTVPKNGGTTPTMAGGEGGHLVAGK